VHPAFDVKSLSHEHNRLSKEINYLSGFHQN